MTQPNTRKRRRSKKGDSSVKEPTAVVASKVTALDRPREVDETGANAPPKTLVTGLRAAADQLSAGSATATGSVDTPAGADRSSGDAEPIALANDINSRCTDTALAGTSKGGALNAGQTSPVTDISTPSSFTTTEHQ
ncbi:hypothetical protein BJ875DRAFT_488850 [Amylocarpus encephaloides]|uniref:Uncharacterized protein n=1 Tax=Amylocarpus encephaloides TaxID=45428 RepID=A0A9P8C151_9HELO|nr:hypothetical protein BJ875DRAFT_488850 [Amylocarpus encephaloides]